MNHCGHPECECYRKKCCDFCSFYKKVTANKVLPACKFEGDCICHTEKPAQEKAVKNGLIGEFLGYYAEVPAPPLGDWETRLMDEFCVMFERATRDSDATDWVAKMERFIHDLLVSEIANAEMEGLHHGNINGAKAERERLVGEVGKLRIPVDDILGKDTVTGISRLGHNEALDAVLSLLQGGEIKS